MAVLSRLEIWGISKIPKLSPQLKIFPYLTKVESRAEPYALPLLEDTTEGSKTHCAGSPIMLTVAPKKSPIYDSFSPDESSELSTRPTRQISHAQTPRGIRVECVGTHLSGVIPTKHN